MGLKTIFLILFESIFKEWQKFNKNINRKYL